MGRESRELVPSRPVLDTISLLKPTMEPSFTRFRLVGGCAAHPKMEW